ncbi:MAG: helix-turn-helix domain-containing protein [Tyzzerella sp.]|nr:helix-turn-helix domain-containing protein [Tyzzerella sp.]
MAFYERLKEARVNARLTQEQLAEKIGVAKTTLSGYENGNREPSVATVAKLMQALQVDANHLYQDEMENLTQSEMWHMEKYRSLDRHGRELVQLVLDKEFERVKNTSFTQNKTKGFESLSEEDLEIIKNGFRDTKEEREVV